MLVLIEKAVIKNFKSCLHAEVRLAAYTPLIGYNNSGKSNVISAVQWLLKKSSLDVSDFNDPNLPVEISGEITGITAEDTGRMPAKQQQQIAPYVNAGKLEIKRIQLTPNAKVAEIAFEVLNPTTGAWVPNPTGIDNALGVLLPEPIRIGAMEDAAEDSSKAKTTTTIGKLLAEFIGPVRDAHEEEINRHLDQVSRMVAHDGDERLSELDTIDESINEKIQDLFPGIGIKLHFSVPNLGDLIKGGTIRVFEDNGAGRGFSSYGHGAQRSIQMALVRHLAEVRRTSTGHAGTTLLLIDEPELYLHPFAIEQIREALITLSKNGYQVIISTHSAQMVTAAEAQHTLLIRKTAVKGTHTRMRLRDAIQTVVPNSVSQMQHLFALGNSSQVLFADQVVLAEGKTEVRLIPILVKAVINRTLGQQRVALVSQDGSLSTQKSMNILGAMDLPTKAIVDLDFAFKTTATDFIPNDNADVLAIKAIFTRLAGQGKITLNPETGTPMKGIVPSSAAFAFMAAEPDAGEHIENLHNLLRTKNIWLWKKGTIENHLGLSAKNETEWARFQVDLEQNGIAVACPDHQEVTNMVNWACN